MLPRLWELGVRALPQADHHETHPLGRAEWLKLLALLGNREARANDRFDRIEAEYQRLAALVQDVPMRPAVMSGFAAGRATFETFGAANQRAQLIRDAGGDYVLGDASPSSLLYVPFESIYADGAAADVWLGTLGGQPDIDAWTRTNPLHGWFRPAATGQVYAWDRGYTGAWASPYQDQSMTKPHVQLAEAISALHPAVLPMADGQYEFLRRLP
jgi:iron complex transport system substrate-binding protein